MATVKKALDQKLHCLENSQVHSFSCHVKFLRVFSFSQTQGFMRFLTFLPFLLSRRYTLSGLLAVRHLDLSEMGFPGCLPFEQVHVECRVLISQGITSKQGFARETCQSISTPFEAPCPNHSDATDPVHC